MSSNENDSGTLPKWAIAPIIGGGVAVGGAIAYWIYRRITYNKIIETVKLDLDKRSISPREIITNTPRDSSIGSDTQRSSVDTSGLFSPREGEEDFELDGEPVERIESRRESDNTLEDDKNVQLTTF